MQTSLERPRRTVSRALVWTLGGSAGQMGLRLVVVAVLARLLDPTDFGVVAASLVVIVFAQAAAELGLPAALVQRAELTARQEGAGTLAALAAGLGMAAVVAASSNVVARLLGMPSAQPVLSGLSLALVPRALAIVPLALLQREERFRGLATVQLAAYALGYAGVATAGGLAGWGAMALVAGQVGQATLEATGAWMLRRPARPCWDLGALRMLMSFGGGMTVTRLLNLVGLQADTLVVAKLVGAEALGFYNRAYTLMGVPARLFSQGIDTVLFPRFARMQTQPKRLRGGYRQAVSWSALLLAPPAAALVALAQDLVLVVLGPGWATTGDVLGVFAFGLYVRTAYKIPAVVVRSLGRSWRLVTHQALYAASVILGGIVGAAWGPVGVAAGVVGAVTVHFILLSASANWLLAVPLSRWVFWQAPGLVIAVIVYALTTTLHTYTTTRLDHPLARLAVTAAALALLGLSASALALCRGPRSHPRESESAEVAAPATHAPDREPAS